MLSLDFAQLLPSVPEALSGFNLSENTAPVPFQRGWQGQHGRSGAGPGAGTHPNPCGFQWGIRAGWWPQQRWPGDTHSSPGL